METSQYGTNKFRFECSKSFSQEIFVTSPGAVYRNPVSYSHYNQPLDVGGVRGNSRLWGDASLETQAEVVQEILTAGRNLKLNPSELAFALAVAKVESGFNPDAAAGTTSASGVGQLINTTAEALGIKAEKRFDLKENVRGFLTLLKENLRTARKTFSNGTNLAVFQRAYALYHDGPSLNYGGLEIAKNSVLPNMAMMERWVRCADNR